MAWRCGGEAPWLGTEGVPPEHVSWHDPSLLSILRRLKTVEPWMIRFTGMGRAALSIGHVGCFLITKEGGARPVFQRLHQSCGETRGLAGGGTGASDLGFRAFPSKTPHGRIADFAHRSHMRPTVCLEGPDCLVRSLFHGPVIWLPFHEISFLLTIQTIGRVPIDQRVHQRHPPCHSPREK
jgi:hypothetical protein